MTGNGVEGGEMVEGGGGVGRELLRMTKKIFERIKFET